LYQISIITEYRAVLFPLTLILTFVLIFSLRQRRRARSYSQKFFRQNPNTSRATSKITIIKFSTIFGFFKLHFFLILMTVCTFLAQQCLYKLKELIKCLKQEHLCQKFMNTLNSLRFNKFKNKQPTVIKCRVYFDEMFRRFPAFANRMHKQFCNYVCCRRSRKVNTANHLLSELAWIPLEYYLYFPLISQFIEVYFLSLPFQTFSFVMLFWLNHSLFVFFKIFAPSTSYRTC